MENKRAYNIREKKYNNKNKQKTIMAENNLKKLFKAIEIALKSAPPPDYIPDNVCCVLCHACHGEWFENTITTFRCQCKELRLCPTCANGMKEPEVMEHNLVDCNYYVVSESENEDSDNEDNNINWVESLGKNIIESVTLEIGNPIEDGHNYIKKVITRDELKK